MDEDDENGGAHASHDYYHGLQHPGETSSSAFTAIPPTTTNSTTTTSNPDQLPTSRSPNPSPRYATPTFTGGRSASRVATSSPAASSISDYNRTGAASPATGRRTSSSMSQRPSLSPNLLRKGSNTSLRSVANTSQPQSPTASRRSSSSAFGQHHHQHQHQHQHRNSSSTLSGPPSNSLPTQMEEEAPPAATPASVATEYFARELAAHECLSNAAADVVVIIHDDCYGHRFSRPRTTKSHLSMIVERPERLLASVLGVSAAYVRLGSRHKGGDSAPHPDRLPGPGLPFKIRKSSRSVSVLSSEVTAVHGKDWMQELETMANAAGQKLALNLKELERPAQTDGTAAAAAAAAAAVDKPPFHEGDLYLCGGSLDAFQGAIGGVCDAVDSVFSAEPDAPKRAFVAVRPPGHHCSADFPSGFCWINNVHIGIEYAARHHGLTHAVILDFDLHHGDGSQDITWSRNEKSFNMPKNTSISKKTAIGYYSMHDINSYPCESGDREKVQNASLCIDNAHGQSIWNVHLEPWTTMDHFWALYETKYRVLLEKARGFLKRHTALVRAAPRQIQPRSAIFISAGFDASEWEGAGMQRHAVNVPTEFYARFTRDVVKLAQESGTGVDGRVISVLEGGYSDRALTTGVMSHLSGLCQPPKPTPETQPKTDDDVLSALQRMNISAVSDTKPDVKEYDIAWWHTDNITALENYITPPPPPPAKSKRTVVPTYATPTASFTHKVVDPENFKRSISSTMRHIITTSAPRPAPEVDWIVATVELSKLLLPADGRDTRSCKPEDLAAPRVKKERLSEPPVMPAPTSGGRQLRERKTRTPDITSSPPPEAVERPVSVMSGRRHPTGDGPLSLEGDQPRSDPRRSSKNYGEHSTATPPPARTGAMGAQARPASRTVAPTRPDSRAAVPPKVRKPRAPATKTASSAATPTTQSPAKAKSQAANGTPKTSSNGYSRESTAESTTSDRSGPKRITLKLGSREESARKQREKEEAEKKAKVATRVRSQEGSLVDTKPEEEVTVGATPGLSAPWQERIASPSVIAPTPPPEPTPAQSPRFMNPEELGLDANAMLAAGFGPPHSTNSASSIPGANSHMSGTMHLDTAGYVPSTMSDSRLSPPIFTPTLMNGTPMSSLPTSPMHPETGFSHDTGKGGSFYPSNFATSTSHPMAPQSVLDNATQQLQTEQSSAEAVRRGQQQQQRPPPPHQRQASSESARKWSTSLAHRGPPHHPPQALPQLPVFSSTGSIPFGAPPAASAMNNMPAYKPAGRAPVTHSSATNARLPASGHSSSGSWSAAQGVVVGGGNGGGGGGGSSGFAGWRPAAGEGMDVAQDQSTGSAQQQQQQQQQYQSHE